MLLKVRKTALQWIIIAIFVIHHLGFSLYYCKCYIYYISFSLIVFCFFSPLCPEAELRGNLHPKRGTHRSRRTKRWLSAKIMSRLWLGKNIRERPIHVWRSHGSQRNTHQWREVWIWKLVLLYGKQRNGSSTYIFVTLHWQTHPNNDKWFTVEALTAYCVCTSRETLVVHWSARMERHTGWCPTPTEQKMDRSSILMLRSLTTKIGYIWPSKMHENKNS